MVQIQVLQQLPMVDVHNTWEDIALMRAIPNAVVCDAADEVQMKWIIKEFSKLSGIHYVRASRKAARKIYTDNSTFEIGKGNILKGGKDVLIISAGQLVSEALIVLLVWKNKVYLQK